MFFASHPGTTSLTLIPAAFIVSLFVDAVVNLLLSMRLTMASIVGVAALFDAIYFHPPIAPDDTADRG